MGPGLLFQADIPRVEKGVQRPRRADEISYVFPVVSS